MKRCRLVCLLGVVAAWMLAFAPIAPAALITIQNSSFENPSYTDGGYDYVIPGWVISGSGGAGVWNPALGQAGVAAGFLTGIPDGVQVGFSNGGDISQALAGNTLTPGYTYTLSVWIGGRNTYSGQPFAAILAGNTALAQVSGTNSEDAWQIFSASYTETGAHAGETLAISLFNNGGTQLNFDKVSLDASPVPEPGTMMLLGSGLVGLAGYGRRRMKK